MLPAFKRLAALLLNQIHNSKNMFRMFHVKHLFLKFILI